MTAAPALPLRSQLHSFWQWWTTELNEAIPPRLRPVGRRKGADIHCSRAGILVERECQGESERHFEERPLESLDEEGWAELAELIGQRRPRLILAPPEVYFTTIELPAAASRNLRSAVALQLHQHAPIDPDRLLWNCRRIDQDRRSVTMLVAMAQKRRTEEILASFAEFGLPAPSLVARSGGNEMVLAAGSRTEAQRSRRRVWAAAAMLPASIPFTTWLAALATTAATENRVRSLHEELAPKIAAERSAARDEAVRRALRTVYELPAATAAIEGLALGLPDSAFATSAERQFDGAFSVETQTTDRAALESAMAEAPLLAGLDPTSESRAEDGRLRLSYRGLQR